MFGYLLIGINVLVSLLAFGASRTPERAERFLFIPSEVAQGRNFTGMVLSHFSHADMGHLFFNMITLYFFAPVVEYGLGAGEFLAVYILSGVGATLLTYLIHRNDPRYRALGASGSVSGVIFAAIVVYPPMSIYFFFVPIPIPGPVFAVGYVLVSIILAKKRVGNIGHEAHIGGALVGFLLGGMLYPEGFAPLMERVKDFLPG